MESTSTADRADVPPTKEDLLATHVREHARGVWRYLRLLRCPEQEAEDLCQEAFLVALERGLGDRDRQETGAFLRQTAAHLYLRQNSRDRRRAALLAEATERLWQRHCVDDQGTALLATLRGCVGELTGRAQRVIELVYEEGLGRVDTAHELGLTADGVKSLLQRVRRSLKNCVGRRMNT